MDSVLVSLFLVLLLAWVAGIVADRLGLPAVLGELLAGIVFGPAALGALTIPEWVPLLSGHPLGFSGQTPEMRVLAEIGVFLLMLYIGLEVDFRDLWRSARLGLLASIGGFTIPFVAGYLLAGGFGVNREGALFLGLSMGITSLAIKSRILVDLNLFGTRVAAVLMAGALISDTAALILFALVMGLAEHKGAAGGDVALVLAKNAAFFAVAVAVGIKGFPLLGGFFRRAGMRGRTANFTLVVLIGLIYAELAHLLGLHAVVGAFLAGMFLREGVMKRRISHDITGLVKDLSLGFLAPVFYITVGFQVTLGVVHTHALLLILVLATATLSKILGVVLFYRIGGYGWREGLVVGLGMNGRGAMEIVFAQIALNLGVISQEVFSILVIMAVFTTLTVPAGLKWGVSWLRRRNELAGSAEARRGAIIVGARPLGRAIGRALAERGEPVCLIDTNRGRCAAAERDGLSSIHGSAVNEETLAVAGASEARALLAMTGNAAVNDLVAQIARDLFRVPDLYRIHTDGRNGNAPPPSLETPNAAGARPLFSTSVDPIEWDRILTREEYERKTTEFTDASEIEAFSQNGDAPNSILPLLVERKGQCIPAAAEPFLPGDKLHYLRHRADSDPHRRRLLTLLKECPVLDLAGPLALSAFLNQAAEALAGRLNVPVAELHLLLEERERESSTVIAPGLAIPHVILDGTGRFELLAARCLDGVEFPEAGKVRMLFVLLSSRDERAMYLRSLSTIARRVGAPRFERQWLEAADAEELRALLLHPEAEYRPRQEDASTSLE